MSITLEPIGYVAGGRAEPVDDDWGNVEATVVLEDGLLEADAILGLDEFSHLEVVYLFTWSSRTVSPGGHAGRGGIPTGRRSASSPSGPRPAPTASA